MYAKRVHGAPQKPRYVTLGDSAGLAVLHHVRALAPNVSVFALTRADRLDLGVQAVALGGAGVPIVMMSVGSVPQERLDKYRKQDGSEPSLGMDGDVDGEIAQLDLFASGTQRPLVWEQDGAVGLLAGEFRSGSAKCRGWSAGGYGGGLTNIRSATDKNKKRAECERTTNDAHVCEGVCAIHCGAGKEASS